MERHYDALRTMPTKKEPKQGAEFVRVSLRE